MPQINRFLSFLQNIVVKSTRNKLTKRQGLTVDCLTN